MLAGVAGSQVEGDGYAGYYHPGLILGGFVNTDFSEKVYTQLEIYYIKKGSLKQDRPDKGDFDYFKLNFNYAEIPIIVGYRVNNFSFEAGLYYANLFNYYMEDENIELDDRNAPFKKYDFGGLLGLSYSINNNLSFNIRSKASIIPIRNFTSFDQNIGILNKLFNRGWYNLDLNFTLRYQFSFK